MHGAAQVRGQSWAGGAGFLLSTSPTSQLLESGPGSSCPPFQEPCWTPTHGAAPWSPPFIPARWGSILGLRAIPSPSPALQGLHGQAARCSSTEVEAAPSCRVPVAPVALRDSAPGAAVALEAGVGQYHGAPSPRASTHLCWLQACCEHGAHHMGCWGLWPVGVSGPSSLGLGSWHCTALPTKSPGHTAQGRFAHHGPTIHSPSTC